MKILAIVLMLFASLVHADEYQPYEVELVAASNVIVETAKKDGATIDVVSISKYDPMHSQVFMYVDVAKYGKVCNLVLNIESRASTDQILGRFMSSKEFREAAILASWLHEYGNCLRLTKRNFVWFEDTGDSREEGFADVYALAWIHQNKPEYFDNAARFFVNLRRQVSSVYYSELWAKKKDLIASSSGTPFEIATKIVFGN